jgi:hypothetical protein
MMAAELLEIKVVSLDYSPEDSREDLGFRNIIIEVRRNTENNTAVPQA